MTTVSDGALRSRKLTTGYQNGLRLDKRPGVANHRQDDLGIGPNRNFSSESCGLFSRVSRSSIRPRPEMPAHFRELRASCDSVSADMFQVASDVSHSPGGL